jgi:hypothetical protein
MSLDAQTNDAGSQNSKDLAVAVILDRSGSMGSIRDDTIGSFNTFVDDLKKQQGRTLLTLVQFDTEGIETVYDSIPIQEVTPLTRETYIPRGGTPLLDAIGHTLASMETKLATKTWTGSVMATIITDGFENASHEWTFSAIRRRIKQLDEDKDWAFTFLGASSDVLDQVDQLGIARGSSAFYATRGKNVRAAGRSMSSQAMRWRSKMAAKHELILEEDRRQMTED